MSQSKSPVARPGPGGEGASLPFIRIYVRNVFVRNFKLSLGTLMAGRDPAADIFIEDRFASRRHFQVEYQGENRLYIQDLKSSNGTYLNGKQVVRAPLGHGDEILLGETRITVSHRAYAKTNVIPFPDVRTEPHVDISKLGPLESQTLTTRLEDVLGETEVEPVPPPVVEESAGAFEEVPSITEKSVGTLPEASVPSITEKSVGAQSLEAWPSVSAEEVLPAVVPAKRIRNVAFFVFVVVPAAGAMAWGFNQWWQGRQAVDEGVPVASAPQATTETEVTPLSESPSLPKRVAQAIRKKLHRSGAPTAVKKKKGRRSRTGSHEKFMNSLDESLKGLDTGSGLGAADQLRASERSDSGSKLKGLKNIASAPTQAMDVEIQMPRGKEMNEILARQKSQKVRTFDPKEYSLMLKKRVRGVETCYARHGRPRKDVGKISIWFSISGKGRVQKVGIRSAAFKNAGLEKCIVSRISKLNLDPPPWDGFTVTYGLRFGPSKLQF